MEMIIIKFAITSIAFMATIFAGAYAWTKLGDHKSLLFFVPVLIGSMLLMFPALPLVKVFTANVLIGIIVSHIAAGAIIASIIAPYLQKKLKKQCGANCQCDKAKS